MDTALGLVSVDGKLITLTPTEFALLTILISNPDQALSREQLTSMLWREPPSLQVMGGLTLMMVSGRRPGADPTEVNRLLDAAFSSLAELGDEVYAAFVRDQIGFSDFTRFMRATARKHPAIFDDVFRQLSAGELWRWSLRFGRLALQKWRTG